jgi:class 3 adenylate cyclase
MTRNHTIPVEEALILFADVIDSSKYSATLGYTEYARRLHDIQALFKDLGREYFPTLSPDEECDICYSQVDARGDEGTIFYCNPSESSANIIYKAIKFSYELKARLELLWYKEEEDSSPQPMKIGIGIHFDNVALITKNEECEQDKIRYIISHLEGYSINYAKRLESCSRIGKYSKIIISKKAASFLEGDPIVLTKHTSNLKGIQSNEEIFEVRSAFFDKFPNNDDFIYNDELQKNKFINFYSDFENKCDFIHEPWQKSLVLSILDSLYITNDQEQPLKTLYRDKLTRLVWDKLTEDDPIVLFTRAKILGEEKKHTQRLEYLKNLINLYPNFIHARIKLAEACWEVAQKPKERIELVYARNIADEFLNRFPGYLSPQEKELFNSILSNVNSKE